jgi:hypothetical protein
MGATLGDGQTRPYWHGGGKKALKLKLSRAPFKARWGWSARRLDGGARDAMNDPR